VICFLASLLRWLTFTNLDREPEWARYSGMPAGSKVRAKVRWRRGHEREPQSFPLLEGSSLCHMGASIRVVLCCIH
jgi:hypothetical protein